MIEESIIIQASASDIFKQYQDVESWNIWDKDVKSSTLKGDFITGAVGELQPASGPKGQFTLTEVTPNHSFTSETKLPLCTIIFEHTLKESKGATQATHRVIFQGLLSFVFVKLIGTGIKKGLPNALKGLKSVCEAGE